ncbi:MAG: hypothetical protein VCA12_16780 [Pseudomonadales bacterium]
MGNNPRSVWSTRQSLAEVKASLSRQSRYLNALRPAAAWQLLIRSGITQNVVL